MADISFSSADLTPVSVNFKQLIAGEPLGVGDMLYSDSTDESKARKARANTAARADAIGIATSAVGQEGQQVSYLPNGASVILDNAPLTLGTDYRVSSNGGGIAPAADQTGGEFITHLFTAESTSAFTLNIHATGVTA